MCIRDRLYILLRYINSNINKKKFKRFVTSHEFEMADLVAHCEATQFAGAVTCSHGALGSDETGSDDMRRMI